MQMGLHRLARIYASCSVQVIMCIPGIILVGEQTDIRSAIDYKEMMDRLHNNQLYMPPSLSIYEEKIFFGT